MIIIRIWEITISIFMFGINRVNAGDPFIRFVYGKALIENNSQ